MSLVPPPFSPSSLPPFPPHCPSSSSFFSLLLQSYPSPSLFSPPLIPLFFLSSSNSTHEAFNATHPLHVNLHDPTLLSTTAPSTSAPSSPVITLFFSSSSFLPSSPPLHHSHSSFTLLLLQSHPSLPLFPSSSPPILPFSVSSFSSSNPTHEAFNTAPLHANLYDPILPIHGGSLHVRPFLASDLSFSSSPSFSPPSPPCYTSSFSFSFLLLQSQHSLLLPPPPIPLFPFSSSTFSFKPIHETFNTVLPLHGGSPHPYLAGDPFNMSKSHFRPLKWQINTVY